MTAAMRTASPALARRSSGFGNPRSAKTLPLPSSTSMVLAMFFYSFAPLPCGVFFLGPLEARLDQVDLRFRRLYAGLRLLLESVQHIYATGQASRIDGALCVTVMVLDDLQNSSAAEAAERFHTCVFSA